MTQLTDSQRQLQAAFKLHQAGALGEARPMYEQLLNADPERADALHMLGVLHYQQGDPATALILIDQAIEKQPTNAVYHGNRGMILASKKRTEEAIACYQHALKLKPDYAEALSNLGTLFYSQGKIDLALEQYRKMTQTRPDYTAGYPLLGQALLRTGDYPAAAAAYQVAIDRGVRKAAMFSDMGNALLRQGKTDQALAAYEQALVLDPNFALAHNNIGHVHHKSGNFTLALASFDRAVACAPRLADAFNNRGSTLIALKRFDDAIASLQRALELRPEFPQAFNNLGMAYMEIAQAKLALDAFTRATELQPMFAEAHCNRGNVFLSWGRYPQAMEAFEKAIECQPNFAIAYNNLGGALKSLGRFDDSVVALNKSIEQNPKLSQAQNNLGNVHKEQGQIELALADYQRALDLSPDDSQVHSNWVYTLQFHPDYDAYQQLKAQRDWAGKHAPGPLLPRSSYPNNRDPDRPLRIGYISPDFRDHVVARNLLPLLQHHDRARYRIACYSATRRPDAFTDRFRACAADWRDIAGMTDDSVAAKVREDQIDILVDCTLHMSHHRLLVMAKKPAPVQVTCGGYPGGTGLAAIDWRLTDPFLDPPGEHDDRYVERSYRLPHSFWCYDPAAMGVIDQAPPGPLPALSGQPFTWGCLNNFSKVTPQVLDAWATVVQRTPGSRLITLCPAGSHRQRVVGHFTRRGVEAGRISFVPFAPRDQYLAQYRQVDLGLDCFPYNGHTTSLDSTWMGVPVVTLLGTTVVGRAGWSQLCNLGLTELAATTLDAYIDTAVALANDLPRLNAIRQELRPRMLRSPLCDVVGFTRSIEQAYRDVWQEWVKGDG